MAKRRCARGVEDLPDGREGATLDEAMQQVKDTLRATVRLSFDGRVFKTFRGLLAEERFANEVKVLRYLESRGCPFVPRLLEADPATLRIITTNCGARVEHLDEERMREIYAELEEYGVRHEDAELRNVTYRQSDGRFCLIDFEFATILDDSAKPSEAPDNGVPTESPPVAGAPAVVRLDGPRAGAPE